MKNKQVAITAALLAISISNYLVVIKNKTARPVELISILVIGALAGILLTQIINNFKDKKKCTEV